MIPKSGQRYRLRVAACAALSGGFSAQQAPFDVLAQDLEERCGHGLLVGTTAGAACSTTHRATTSPPPSPGHSNRPPKLPLAKFFGGGTLSSSDGQRFPVKGKSTTARPMKKYFAGQGLSTYTHVSDQHTTFGTKVIVVTRREAHYVLDEIMGNKTDLPITEHATDTHGLTLVNSPCSTWSACSSPRASATWARSPCTGWTRNAR
jgi:hypothetical protein